MVALPHACLPSGGDSNHRSHRRQIYSVEQTHVFTDDFGVVPLFFLIQFSVRQLCRRFAPVFGINVRIDLRDLDGRVPEQGLHGAQFGAALIR